MLKQTRDIVGEGSRKPVRVPIAVVVAEEKLLGCLRAPHHLERLVDRAHYTKGWSRHYRHISIIKHWARGAGGEDMDFEDWLLAG